MQYTPQIVIDRQENSHDNTAITPTNNQIFHVYVYVSFCLIKKDRRWDSCQAHVTPSTVSWIRIHRTTRALVLSD